MKILLLQEADWFKRGPHQQHHIMEKLSLRNHKVSVIDYPFPYNNKYQLLYHKKILLKQSRIYNGSSIDIISPFIINIPVIRYIIYFMTSKEEIIKIIKNDKPDLIIGYCSILNNYLGMKLSKKHKIPFIYYWVDVIDELIPGYLFKFIGRYFIRKNVKGSSMIIAGNRLLLEYIKNKYNINNIISIAGGVDVSRYNINVNDKVLKNIKMKYIINPDELILMYIGLIYPFSGIKEIINVIKTYNNPKIKLFLIGSGNYWNNIEKYINDHNLKESIIMINNLDYQMIPYYLSCADVCILPAYEKKIMKYIVPIKVYEYLACSKLVITTKLPGIMKEFDHNNGIIYVNDQKEIIDTAIQYKYNNKIEENGKIAAKTVIKYNWDEIVDCLENLMINIVNNG